MYALLIVAAAALVWLTLNGAKPQGTQSQGATATTSGGLDSITQAIARMEVYFKSGSLAQRTNNPGDIGTYGGKVASYPDSTSGWSALNTWVRSHAAAHPNWDFYDIIRYYLTGDTMGTAGSNQNPDAYAEYVAQAAGVDPSTPVSSVIG